MTAWYVVGKKSTVDVTTYLIHFSEFCGRDKYEKL